MKGAKKKSIRKVRSDSGGMGPPYPTSIDADPPKEDGDDVAVAGEKKRGNRGGNGGEAVSKSAKTNKGH